MSTQNKRLVDVVKTQEVSISDKPRRRAVGLITASDKAKDKQISAKVNCTTYDLFTQINKAQGLSNNSALNMILNQYVREHKGILEEENADFF